MRRTRQQHVFLDLSRTLNELPAYSKKDFQRLPGFYKEAVKLKYHNYLDACEEMIHREGNVTNLKKEMMKRSKKLNKLCANQQKNNFTKIMFQKGKYEYQIRLLKWYKYLQFYYIYDLEFPDFKPHYHPEDPHINDENNLFAMEYCIDDYKNRRARYKVDPIVKTQIHQK